MISYNLRLVIPREHLKSTLDIFNSPLVKEHLEKHCQKRCSGLKVPVKKDSIYIWSINPENPYENLEDAFMSWNLVNNLKIETEEDYIISGNYHFLLGEQEFLLEKLSKVLCDCEIPVYRENELYCLWIIKNKEYLKVIF
jgi:hypothetical protein